MISRPASLRVRANVSKGAAVADEVMRQAAPFLGPAMREFPFHESRRWRFDLAWPERHLACEVEGGAFVGGAHGRGAHFRQDAEKYSEAAARGWILVRVLPEHVTGGQALYWLRCAAKMPPTEAWAWGRRVTRRGRKVWVLRQVEAACGR